MSGAPGRIGSDSDRGTARAGPAARSGMSPRRWVAALAAGAALGALAGGVLPARQKEDRPLRPTGVAPERAEVNLVLVDVLVRGKDGSPARELTQADFELLIDRLPAPMSSFESYCAPPSDDGGGAPPAAAPEGPAAGARAAGTPDPRHVILFFDMNHLTRPGRNRSVDAALKYLRESKRDADLVMLLAMKGRPILLEPYTADRAALERRLTEFGADDSLLDNSVIEERLNIADILAKDCAPQDPECHARLNVATTYALEEEHKARRSLTALMNLMPALAPIRGRKTIVHFSETLRDEPGLQYMILVNQTAERAGVNLKPLIQDLHKAANAAGVSFYPVFAAGLGEGSGSGVADASVRLSSQDVLTVQRAKQAGEDGALGLETTLALETGGIALKRSNDLSKVFDAVNEDLSCYYVIGYANPGPGDGKRHSIIVKVKRKGFEVRHRPYFEDFSERDRIEQKFQSALLAPMYYRNIPVSVEAYALVPEEKTTPLLLKVEFPLESVSLLPQADGRRAGVVEVRGTIWDETKEVHRFTRRIPIEAESDQSITGRKVIYEAGVDLPPGRHMLTAAVRDAGTGDVGAGETEMPVRARPVGIAGDVLLWTSSSGDILVATDAAEIGIRDSGSGHGFVPRIERRFGQRETGLLYVVVCPPPAGAANAAPGPIEVKRTLFAGDLAVATFPTVTLGAAAASAGAQPGRAQASGGCEGIFAPIPPGRLGPGGYVYEVEVTGIGTQPIVRRAGFAVDEAPPSPSGQ